MPIDSVSNLLFNIGANSDDAEENVQRFRALLGTDLDAIQQQFADWSEDVFGKIDTVKGALIGMTAGVGALSAAVAAFGVEAADKFGETAIAIDDASRKTGISVEEMSKLHFAASEIGVSFESLSTGLVRLSRSMFSAGEGSKETRDAFARLGITEKDLNAGRQNMLPLLEKMADRYTHLKDGAEKAAISQELFSRGGSELIRLLNLGSAGIKELSGRATELGDVIGKADVRAARDLKAGIEGVHAQMEAFEKTVAEKALPVMSAFYATVMGLGSALHAMLASPAGSWTGGWMGFGAALAAGFSEAREEMQRTVDLATKMGGDEHLGGAPGDEKTKAAAEGLKEISTQLGEVKIKLAEMEGPGAKLNADLEQMQQKADDAAKKLVGLLEAGKITAATWKEQTNALYELHAAIDKWGAAMREQIAQKDLDELQRYLDKINTATESLESKIAEQSTDKGFAHQAAMWDAQMDQLRRHMVEEGTFVGENVDLWVNLVKSGMDRIAADQDSAYAREISKLAEHHDRLMQMEMTREQKLAADYQKDLQEFSQAEEQKALRTATDDKQRAALEQQYAAVRAQITAAYQKDLQALLNSQGWQGVFGDHFAQMIKHNEQLMREWATSTNQSTMMVKVALESMKEMGGQAFDKFAEGMGGGIANAMVYSKSIGQAMRQATAATLESIAAQSMVQAIYSLALGFKDIAEQDYPGAAAAFEAAALFGAVGVGSGVAGRAVAGPGGVGGGGGGGGGARGSGGAIGGSGGGGGTGSSPQSSASVGGVSVHVYGHVIGASGIEQLCSMISDSVQNRDVRLIATQARQSTPATF